MSFDSIMLVASCTVALMISSALALRLIRFLWIVYRPWTEAEKAEIKSRVLPEVGHDHDDAIELPSKRTVATVNSSISDVRRLDPPTIE